MSKLYVLVRGDLSKSQQAVQASHAVAEFMLWGNKMPCSCGRCNDKYWENGTIILKKVSREQLSSWMTKAIELKYPNDAFFEPDVQDYTAVAIFDTDEKLQELVAELPLL